ncbi:MAG TPA: hypothetical protein VK699_15785 [Terriglobales bacterium]|jgi:hypothetical protein|nr:hypothetical protein [Terriglobales bacterium]
MPQRFTWFLVLAAAVSPSVTFAQDEKANSTEKHTIVVETDTGRYGAGAERLDPRQLGVAIYPGARVSESKDNETKDNGANLFLDLGNDSTHLYAQKYISSDSAEKVVAFYHKQLARYGAVLECRNGKPVNADDAKAKCDSGDDDKDIELKAGTQTKQHIVGITPTAGGTEFAIVYLDQTKSKQ